MNKILVDKNRQTGNEILIKEIKLIKELINYNEFCPFYILAVYSDKQIFLYNFKIYWASYKVSYNQNNEPDINSVQITELYEIILYKDYPKTKDDFEVRAIIENNISEFPFDDFLFWIDSPSEITESIDEPYYKIINLLINFPDFFQDNDYLFYFKVDGDYNNLLNLYCKNKTTNTLVKIYSKEEYYFDEYLIPENKSNLYIDDFNQNLTNYQKSQIKKSFFNLSNELNLNLNIKNYRILELIYYALNPLSVLREWSLHRCFCEHEIFRNIYVYDIPEFYEEPSFILTDDRFNKLAVISFKRPEYLFKGIYKRGLIKRKSWKLGESLINELIEFLNAPSESRDEHYRFCDIKKYVKTNWQQLIFEYNHNSAIWGFKKEHFEQPPDKIKGLFKDIEALPFNLPIPDFRKLLNER